MITLRRAKERLHVMRGKQDMWLTFYPQDQPGPLADGFGFLAALDETRLPPVGCSGSHRRDESELITYVYRGALAQEDSTGRSGVIQTGEFQHMVIGRNFRHKERNASRTSWAHVFQITLHPSKIGFECAREQKRFTAAQRRNIPCVVASRDGRKGSLQICQDAFIYSGILDPGHHLVHEILPGRSTWLHIVCGEAKLDDIVLAQGDGVGVTIEPSVSLTVQEKTEILLVDLGPVPDSIVSGAAVRSMAISDSRPIKRVMQQQSPISEMPRNCLQCKPKLSANHKATYSRKLHA
jgi:redox-sensitive bicupin YhaK (pirin superfamily)